MGILFDSSPLERTNSLSSAAVVVLDMDSAVVNECKGGERGEGERRERRREGR